jgi:superfamily II DNA or RNA helicase
MAKVGPMYRVDLSMTDQQEHKSLLARMQFSGIWRDYQQRVLEEFDALMVDQRIHVVAAPGSGKTILGLELARRLGRPALILAPTRAVREQWSSRLVPLFLTCPPGAEELSQKLDRPAILTTSTYQALYALWTDQDGSRFAAMLERLRAIGPVTLILDEAHHLRREWWKALEALVETLPDAKIVALTATPPYDAPFAEWSRYEAMCGPIDLEIGVPELVRNRDLCPHQDHVIFSVPEADTLALLERRRQGVAAILSALRSDSTLLDYLEAHPWLTEAQANVEAILNAPEVLSAIMVYLAASGRRLPSRPLKLLGVRPGDVPQSSAYWSEVLLNALLVRFPDVFLIGEEREKDLRSTLHEFGLIEGGIVHLGESRITFDLMAGSLAKLDSMVSIAREETQNIGAELRMVILTDHVRGGELLRIGKPDYEPSKLGIVPIFDALRRAAINGQKLGVLTGTLIILPVSQADALSELCDDCGVRREDWRLERIPASPDYCRVMFSGEAAERSVELITALFASGAITVLIGTQALLGEGWDAPPINSLVLASNSAAFMLSNQMRGRAIRIDPARPAKVANIWHLATVDEYEPGSAGVLANRFNWGRLDDGDVVTSDEQLLQRRFKAFEGISNTGWNRIEGGIARLGLDLSGGLERSNAKSFAVAHDRSAISERWRLSIGEASAHAHVRETASTNYAPQSLSWNDTLGWLCASAVSGGAFAAAHELSHFSGAEGIDVIGMAVAGSIALVALPKLAKATWLWIRNGSLESSLSQVGKTVLAGLYSANLISGFEAEDASIEARKTVSGRIDIIAHGLSRASERAVMQAMSEVLGPIQNPRYLLERRSWLGSFSRSDYHAIPSAIAARKEWAEDFHAAWRSNVGSSRLIFTRTAQGRVTLLRARTRSFAAGFQRRVDRRSAWL